MQIGHLPIRCPDAPDLLVAGVVDEVHAAPATCIDVALPPGQDRLTLVGLPLEVSDLVVAGSRLRPHEVPAGIDDLRPVLERADLGREEEIARCGRPRLPDY